MMGKRFLLYALLLSLSLGTGMSAAADKTTPKPPAAKAGKANKANKTGKNHRRLSLMPALCAEQFIDTGLNLHLAPPSATADKSPVSPPDVTAPPPRLGLETGWGVVPFVGSALSPLADSPERTSAAGSSAATASAPFCDLDAGVSYSLSRSTNLNLGYRLPSSVWSGVLGPLGEDAASEPSGKKVSIGIDIDF